MKNFKRFILDEAAGKNVITVSGISDMKKADAERLSNVGENILSNLEDLGVANIFDKNIKYKGNLIIIDSDDEDEYYEEDDEYAGPSINIIKTIKDLINNLELNRREDIQDIRYSVLTGLGGKEYQINSITKDSYSCFGIVEECYIIEIK